MSLKSYYNDMENAFLDFVNQSLHDCDTYKMWEQVNAMVGSRTLCFLIFLVVYGVDLMMSQMRRCRKLGSRRTLIAGHLGYYKQRMVGYVDALRRSCSFVFVD